MATTNRWTVERIPDLAGRTFVVTGANSGLGRFTTAELARHGAHVIMAVRDPRKGADEARDIIAANPSASLDVRTLDLADLDSVRSFADELVSEGIDVDVLINNAGIMMPPRSLTPQGNELQFGTNHLGHFALTGLLLDTIATGRDPRVVTVSSTLHRGGRIHFDDLTGATSYSPTSFYAQSKYANVLFGLELDRRLRAAGSPVRSILAHPGYSATNLQTTGPTGFMKQAMKVGNVLMAQHVSKGALNQLYAAVDPGAQGGQFIGPDGMGENRGYPKVVQPVTSALDPALAQRLWDVSEALTGVTYGLPKP